MENIKSFAERFHNECYVAAENSGSEYDYELADTILNYLKSSGEVNEPEMCAFKKTRARLTAYDYNVEAESLDLFYLITTDTLLGKVSKSKLNQGFSYLKKFYQEVMDDTIFKAKDVKKTDELMEVANLVKDSKGNINQLRLYIITNGLVDSSDIPESGEIDGIDVPVEYNVWDIQRIYQQDRVKQGKERVNIDFEVEYQTVLQCLKMREVNDFVDVYLAIIPGLLLAKIYKKYQQIILEKNVRTFLQFKGKVNKGIRNTLKDEPDMFFSYNNGISTTASDIKVEEREGQLYIRSLDDWQIVNGGQTTASLAACLKGIIVSGKDENGKKTSQKVDVNLANVYVAMKVSVIRDKSRDKELVKNISAYANSQSAIRNSDFSANDPYLVDMEALSRSEWIPNGNMKPISKWYFERTRGQYDDQLAQLRGKVKEQFEIEYPKKNKITKTDIAKYVIAWKQEPYLVCKGAETNYELFTKDIKRHTPLVTTLYYRRIIAEGILFNTIDKIVKSKKMGGYKANMVAYIMASLSYLSKRNLDFDFMWENQRVQQEVIDKIEELIPMVWLHLTDDSTPGLSQCNNIGEWTKKTRCWDMLKVKLEKYDGFGSDMLAKDRNDDGSALNEAQIGRMNEADGYSSEFWLALSRWAKDRDLLSPIDRKAAFNFGCMKNRGKSFVSLKQAQYALRIANKAIELGFVE